MYEQRVWHVCSCVVFTLAVRWKLNNRSKHSEHTICNATDGVYVFYFIFLKCGNKFKVIRHKGVETVELRHYSNTMNTQNLFVFLFSSKQTHIICTKHEKGVVQLVWELEIEWITFRRVMLLIYQIAPHGKNNSANACAIKSSTDFPHSREWFCPSTMNGNHDEWLLS